MLLINPSFEVLHVDQGALALLELAGRTCYKTESKICEGSADPFVRKIIQDYKHESVIEHASMTVKFVIDRGVSHELVRHRLCAFSQESTRYCNYAKKGVVFILPPWVNLPTGEYPAGFLDSSLVNTMDDAAYSWLRLIRESEDTYLSLLKFGWTPQQARSVLPNSLKTEIVVTANFREWRHIFKMRTAQGAHPQMREVMIPLLKQVKRDIPVVFEDL